MDWVALVLTPLLAAAGAVGGSVLTSRVTRSGQLWEVVRACSKDLIADDDEASRLAYHQLSELVRTGKLNRSQRAFAREGLKSYLGHA